MEFQNYYQVLGVKKDADLKTIKTAYRKLARKYHPDVNSHAGAEDKFKALAEAYHVLKDTKLRAEFDEALLYESQPKSQRPPRGGRRHSRQGGASFNGDYSDFFNSMFGDAGQSPRSAGGYQSRHARGQDIETELTVSLLDTIKDEQKEIEFTIPADDPSEKPQNKHLKVKVPLGVRGGERIRLSGQGKPGSNGGTAGDLYLLIRVMPHPFFEVAEDNLLITIPMAPWEASLGATVTVPTLDGKVNLVIPPNTPAGKTFRMKGKGLTSKANTGDILAAVKIVLPPAASDAAKALWEDLASCENFDPRHEWNVSG